MSRLINRGFRKKKINPGATLDGYLLISVISATVWETTQTGLLSCVLYPSQIPACLIHVRLLKSSDVNIRLLQDGVMVSDPPSPSHLSQVFVYCLCT